MLAGPSAPRSRAASRWAHTRGRCLDHEPDTADVGSRSPRQARLDGFDLHANVWNPHPG
jgi:hypothetical protein